MRRGRLRLRTRTLAVAALADLDLDLREAEVDDPQTAANVLVLFGNVDVYAPQGVDVDVDVGGITAFGHRREWGSDATRAGAPRVHIRTLSLLGTVDVWRVPHQMRGSYGEITQQLEEGEGR